MRHKIYIKLIYSRRLGSTICINHCGAQFEKFLVFHFFFIKRLEIKKSVDVNNEQKQVSAFIKSNQKILKILFDFEKDSYLES